MYTENWTDWETRNQICRIPTCYNYVQREVKYNVNSTSTVASEKLHERNIFNMDDSTSGTVADRVLHDKEHVVSLLNKLG